MRTRAADASALTGPFVSEASLRGLRAPLRLLGQGTHGWPVAERAGETLVMDEYGDLWWGRGDARGDIRVSRPCWPEEYKSLHPAIKGAIERLLSSSRL